MHKGLVATLGAAVLATGAGSAHAAVTVIGGGFAEACSNAAMVGESDLRFQDVCTMAIENEMLNARDRAGTFINRGVMKLRKADYEKANKDFDIAVRLKPDIGEGYVNRGASYIGQRRYAESLTEINKGIELGIEEPAKAFYNRALAYEGLEDAKSAYFDYQKALEISPDWLAPRQQLSRFTVSRRGGS